MFSLFLCIYFHTSKDIYHVLEFRHIYLTERHEYKVFVTSLFSYAVQKIEIVFLQCHGNSLFYLETLLQKIESSNSESLSNATIDDEIYRTTKNDEKIVQMKQQIKCHRNMMPEKIKSIFEHLSFTKTRTSIKIIINCFIRRRNNE